MSGWATERKILESWFDSQWKAQPGPWNTKTVPVQYEGQVFDTPSTPYIQMFLLGSDTGTQVSLGTPALDRYVGMIQFTINCPIGGSGGPNETARQIADRLCALFKRRRFVIPDSASPPNFVGIIRCRVPGLHTLGNMSQRWVAVLTVPYLRDEFTSTPGDSSPVLP